MMAKVNWLKARRWFVHGGTDVAHIGLPNKATGKMDYPTFRQIADFYDVTIQTICARNKKENWHDRRQQAQEELDQKLNKNLSDLGVRSLTEINKDVAKIAENVIGLYVKQIIPKTDENGKPIKPMFITSYDVLQFIRLLQEIAEKASGVDGDSDDPIEKYRKVLKEIKGD